MYIEYQIHKHLISLDSPPTPKTKMDSETLPKDRPLSGTEYTWYKAAPTGTGITVLSLLLSRPVPLPILQTTLHNLLNSHPILSSSLSPKFLHVTQTPTPPQILTVNPLPPRVHSFHSLLEHELNLNPWESQDSTSNPDSHVPNFYATLYELPESSSHVLVLRFHTAVCDRTAAAAVLTAVVEGILVNIEGEGRMVNMGDGRVSLGMEEMIRKEDSWKPFWAKGKDLVGYSVNGLRSAMLTFEEVGGEERRRSEAVRLRLTRDETTKLLNACKENGVKLCGAISAAGLIATYLSKHLAENQSETYSVVTLADCRKFLEPPLTDQHAGFYHSAIINTHTINAGEGLWEVALRCHNAYSTAKTNKKHLTDVGDLNYLMCKAIDNPQLTPSSSLRTALISVFEEPVIYENCSELHSKVGVEDCIGCASVHGVGPSIAVFDTIRGGQLDCAFVYPAPLHSRNQMTGLVEHMKQILLQGCSDEDVVEE